MTNTIKAKISKFLISLDNILPPDWYGLVRRYEIIYSGYMGGNMTYHFFRSIAVDEYEKNKTSSLRVTLRKGKRDLLTTLNKPEEGSPSEMVAVVWEDEFGNKTRPILMPREAMLKIQ